jgi:diguanylate cyclase (GGDEF)-like protein
MNAVQSRRLAQEVDDTFRRAAVGGLFYFVAWLVVGGFGGAFSRAPLVSWILAIAFLVFALARFVYRPPREADASKRLHWVYCMWAIVTASGALWGAVFFWSMKDPLFEATRVASLLATLGLATAFAHTFAFRLGWAAAGIALLYLPGLLVMWGENHSQSTAFVATIYLIYVYLSLLRAHADYQHRLDVDQDLRDQRDLFARQSRVDPLTELANRRHFAEVLANATKQARSGGSPLSLLVLDIDHFKAINDEHGHAAGDGVIGAIAARLQVAFPHEGELPARIGGEEFGVVLEGLAGEQAGVRAEGFREGLAARPLLVDGLVLPVTISIGWAEFQPAVHGAVDGLYRAADKALYRAKHEGRNRVCPEPSARTAVGAPRMSADAARTSPESRPQGSESGTV